MQNCWIITFDSVHYAMKAEKILKQNGYEVLLIPVPREISSDCGIALQLSCTNLQKAQDCLVKNGVASALIHEYKQ